MAASSASAAAPRAPAAADRAGRRRNYGARRLFSGGMRAKLLISPVLLVALVATMPSAASGDARTLAAPPASVKLADCSREAHSAAFHGRMKRIDASTRMWMRFTLLEKRLSGFQAVAAPGLERWRKSKPGVGAFGYRQTVRGLQQGGSYRMQVNYRWYDASGELIARAQRRSPPCRQFVALPNLTAELVGTETTKVPGVVRYDVRVANTGIAAASDLAVRLSVDDGVVDTVTVGLLGPGESRTLTFRGPECSTSVTAAADPDGVLVESSEDDNVQQSACADLPLR